MACQLGGECSVPMGWLHYSFPFFFFSSVSARMFHKANPARLHSYQKVPQMVLLIILISWKEKKNPSFQLFTFQKLSISIRRIQCVFPSPSITTNRTIQTWAGYARTLNILLTTFSPGEAESSAHRTLWEGSTFLRLQPLLWGYKHEPPYTGFSFNSLLTNFVNGLNTI